MEKIGNPTWGAGGENTPQKCPILGSLTQFWFMRRWEKMGDPTGGLMEKYTSKVPNFGVFDPILVHEKMGEDGRPSWGGLMEKPTSKVPDFGVF